MHVGKRKEILTYRGEREIIERKKLTGSVGYWNRWCVNAIRKGGFEIIKGIFDIKSANLFMAWLPPLFSVFATKPSIE
jgi:hypothetical protein